MQDVLLLATVTAAFISGWFIIKKVEPFLEENRRAQALQPDPGEDTLRIGFSNPSIADSITNVLEAYSNIYSGSSARIFYGSVEKLIKGLSDYKFNVIFLPENADIPDDSHYNIKEVSLTCTPVITKYGGLQIEPITDGHIFTKILWLDNAGASFTRCLTDYLGYEFAVPEREK